MYINFWYVLAESKQLGSEPLKVKALGQHFVLFRDDDGHVKCLANVCAHRGGSLGGAWAGGAKPRIINGCIVCPYHGWRYDGEGRCQKVPSLPEGAKIPTRARVDAYPVEERYGLIFAFLGDLPEEERIPILELPEWGQDGWCVLTMVYEWQSSFDRVVENVMDATHAEFMHPSASLDGQFREGTSCDTELLDGDDPWGKAFQIKSDSLTLLQGYHGAVQAWAKMRFQMPIPSGDTETGDFHFYSYVTPIDKYSTKRYMLHARNIARGDAANEEIRKTNLQFAWEDRVVVEEVQPVTPSSFKSTDLLLPEEKIMLAYRKSLQAWDQKGWRIDSEQVLSDQDEVAYAIPSPARRTQKAWVLPQVPTCKTGSDSATRS
jgi:phenylpropionate dioxygenase-like ring-hydroxylating dioxygenase large terminal subunit